MALSHVTRLAAFLALICCLAGPARADFHYVPHAPVPVAPPVSADAYSSMAPAPVTPLTMPAPVAPVESAPVDNSGTMVPDSMMAAPHTSSSPAMPGPAMADGGQLAEGFGKHVPLVMALREIAPPSYQLGYGPGVSLGTMVDWSGGQPWREVMKTVLSPLGLQASEQGSVVYIDAAR